MEILVIVNIVSLQAEIGEKKLLYRRHLNNFEAFITFIFNVAITGEEKKKKTPFRM